MTFIQLQNLLDSVVSEQAVPEAAATAFQLGFLQGAVVTAMTRMTPEEQAKFFPGLL